MTVDIAAAVARAAELGREHGSGAGAGWAVGKLLARDDIPAAFGVSSTSEHRFVVTAAYLDSYDIARAEGGYALEWMQPISAAHKGWLRANLVNHADLAAMLHMSVAHITGMAAAGDLPGPVIARPRKHWYWWPHLKPVLAVAGLRLPPDVTPPPDGPAPSWWGALPASADFGGFLAENLMDFARLTVEYDLPRAAILRAGRMADYPEPVINRAGNYWYWWADLDRFLVRHRDIL